MRRRNAQLKKMRDAALYEIYLRGLEEGRFASLCEAADYVIRQPAPRFYISATAVRKHISNQTIWKDSEGRDTPSQRRDFILNERYKAYLKEHPDCQLSLEIILEILVQEPAPEFYIGPEAARQILRREINKRRKRWAGY